MPEVTYGRLDEVLRSLGFSSRLSERPPPTARVYEHEATGAVIILPALPDEEKLWPHHLLAARTTLEGFGIANPLDFDRQVQKAG
jgi:hypothetical protein